MFHLDNTDFLEDTIDGKNTTHALLLVGAKYPTSNEPLQTIPPVKKSGCTKLLPNSFGDLEYCKKPLDRDFKRSLSWDDFYTVERNITFVESCRSYTMPWLILKSLQSILPDHENASQNLSICIPESTEIPIVMELPNTSNSMTDGDSFEEFIEEDQAVEAEAVECIDFTCLNNVPVAQIEISIFDNNDSSGNTICIGCPINQTPDTINVLFNLEKAQCSVKTAIATDDSVVNIIFVCNEAHTNRKWHCFTATKLAVMESASKSLKDVLLPSYSAYNSLIYDRESPNSTANILLFPLVPGPAESYSAIYTAFKLAQNVTTHVIDKSSKTIISLDLDLYERALRLRNSSPDFLDKYVLSLGELHILFAHIRATGRFIENTGIDDAWLQLDLIGPNTIRQGLTCSHVKRSVIVHEVTLLSIFERYVASLLKKFSNVFLNADDSIVSIVTELSQTITEEDSGQVQEIHRKLVEKLHNVEFGETINDFEKEHRNNSQFHMLRIYMNTIQRMLMFIHASSSKNWLLHLHATENLIPDIRSLARIKYCRLLAVYIAEMYALESSDPCILELYMYYMHKL